MRLEIRLLSMAMVEPLVAAHGSTDRPTRELTVVSLTDDGGIGWGECAALGTPGYTSETARSAYDLLRSGRPVELDEHPMAHAALEMARIDRGLRAAGRSLASRLGVERDAIRAGATVGLGPAEAVADRVDDLVAEGYRRVKLKIAPGRDVAIVSAVRARHDAVELQVDANGAYGPDEVGALLALGDLGVSVIEQPVPVGSEAAIAPLLDAFDATVVWDESITGRGAAERLHRAGLLSGLVVKPGRLGGIEPARGLVAWADGHGIPMAVGGLLESGLGRHALTAVAALPGIALTGDVSPTRRWLVADPWPDLTMIDGEIPVPSGPGVAPSPDPERLDAVTIERAVVDVPGP